MSKRRGTAVAASLVCNEDKTKCPVKADCTEISAVSLSRISPTMIMFGSCLKMARRPFAKVIPAAGLIWV